MPYVICSGCTVRSYAAPRSAVEACPVCDQPLLTTGSSAAGPCGSSSDAEPAARRRAGDALTPRMIRRAADGSVIRVVKPR